MTREKAIEVIKEAMPTLWKETKDAIQTLIPELAESDDERIRKAIYDFISKHFKWDDEKALQTRREMLAYLEKQKINTEGDFARGYDCGYEACLNSHGAEWFEKQKEQKHPNGCFTCDEYKKGYEEGRRNGFTAGYNKAIKEVEQNVEQKSAEWSEEEFEIFRKTLAKDAFLDEITSKRVAKKLLNSVKSLRPSWKPTKEQMDALKECGECKRCIKQLHEQLNKL